MLCLLVLCFACSPPNGELITPPAGMEQAVKERIDGFIGMSVREYPNDEYLVTVDYRNKDGEHHWQTIIQKAYSDDGTYWQFHYVTTPKLKKLGVIK